MSFISKAVRPTYVLLLLFFSGFAFAQAPPNDLCSNPSVISIPNAGYALGVFNSDTIDLTNATVETGENFPAAIFVAGQDKKSIWYRFTLPTIRSVRVTLTQPGVAIAAGDAGFSVYKTANCLPGTPDLSTKLTPIATFGNSLHPCADAGDYLVQVSSNQAANGPVFIQLELSDATGALYDRPAQAYAFGVAGNYARYVDFNTECHSLEDATEVCNGFVNRQDYRKSAWFTFTTPAYYDYMSVLLSGVPGRPFNSALGNFGYTLYRGNATTMPLSSLINVQGCDSLRSDGYYAAYKLYRCGDLLPGTTYTIQLFFHGDFKDDLRLGIFTGGTGPTNAPEPVLGSVPAPNSMGMLPASPNGTNTSVSDVFGCNSRLANRNCIPAAPDTGVVVGAQLYNLGSYFTFSLAGTSAINFYLGNAQCGPAPVMRLFKQQLTASCNGLDTANIVDVLGQGSRRIDCLPAGNYTLQVLGIEAPAPSYNFTHYTATGNYEQCLLSHLGSRFNLGLTVYSLNPSNRFSLSVQGAFDTINRVSNLMAPLTDGGTYTAQADTFGCLNTLRPSDTTCAPGFNKVIYRQFSVADSGIVTFSGLTYPFAYKVYQGDAGALAAAQNIFSYPDTISGLVPRTLCMDYYTGCYSKRMCVVPGNYTLTSFGGDGQVGAGDQPTLNYNLVSTVHHSPSTAQDMGSIIDTLGPTGGTLYSDLDYWSCRDNADTINGYAPCVISGNPATKAIYRQFYLREPALVSINDIYYSGCVNVAFGSKTLFKGKATDGPGGLVSLGSQWDCFHQASTTNSCTPLDSGWYTVVSYGIGPTFDNPFQALNGYGGYGSYVGYQDRFSITITITCRGPEFNRPYKASIDTTTNQPYLVQWGNRIDHTPAYPHTDTTYILQEEFFNCTLDTPFAAHPVNACASDVNRVAYYVFRTTQDAYVQIDTKGYYGVLFDRDVRTDSLLFPGLTPVQPCLSSSGHIQICKMRPGNYTLVIFAKDANSCASVQPTIYIDKIGYSRFDFAKSAYDFGVVAPDSVYHYGKTGDVNPLDATRKPSNDFFYCTTGAFSSDPTESACDAVNNNIYKSGTNVRLWDSSFLPSYAANSRRNLWYTFVVNQGGYVRVKVENKTIGKGFQYRFAIYRSNVNAGLPFSTIQSTGQVDSTTAQGLTYITHNESYNYCFNAPGEISFYRDPCNASTDRYYIVVDNPNAYPFDFPGMKPNSQVEVSVLVDSVTLVRPKFDHYYQANNLGAINSATVTRGAVDNYSCATRDAPDPEYITASYAPKTIWYKFSTALSGDVRYRIVVNGAVKYDALYEVQLLRQAIPGDSTSTGLLLQNSARSTVYDASTNSYWATTCVSPGTYYLFLTGYNQLNEYVYPEVQVLEQLGDYCSKPIATQLSGPGSTSAPMLVNCHTIGTDYGEFGPQLTCPVGAATDQYKSSWFRLDITGTDVLDVTTYLAENTNASSSEIKYRLMTGNCGAMQEQSCVLDALTQNTYECLVPGQSYYVQVFTPLLANGQPVVGDIALQLSAVKHTDTCAPLTNCLATANFTTAFDCTTDRTVKFVNFSTYGTAITYRWNFGYNNQVSNAVSPAFLYPATATAQNYTVKLVVTNTSCGKSDSVTRVITVPGRPLVNLGADKVQCNGQPVTLNATSFTGATYLWQDGSENSTFIAGAPGNNSYHVTVTYNNCISRDTINVLINPVTKRPTQNFILCASGDSVLLDASRTDAQSYAWNNGVTSSSVYVRTPGTYWVNVKYASCVIRDSFVVSSVGSLRPLGRDTLVCLRSGNYLLDATTNGATGYVWQNGSTASTFSVSAAGLYWVDIRFAACSVRDSVRITNYPVPPVQTTSASVCAGTNYTLPWGSVVNTAGTYRDTLRYSGGCDSVYRVVTLTIKAKPSLGADKSVSICQGGSVSLSSQFTTTGLTATWTYNGNTVSGNSVSAAGTYRLIAVNTSGCADTALLVLTVNTKPSLGRDSAISICPYFSADLTGLYNTATLTTTWTLNAVAVVNPAVVTAAGNYRLIASNVFSCSDTAIVTLTRLPKPSLGVDKTAGVCPGFSTDLTLLYNVASLTTAWSLGGQAIADPVAANSPGTYQLIAINNSGCADTAVVTLSVNTKPATGNDTAVTRCNGNAVNLNTLYPTAGLSAFWTAGGTAVANPSAVYGAGQYRLIVRNATGCEDTAVVTVTINPKPAVGNDTTLRICPGFSVNLTALYSTGGLSAFWTAGGTAVANPSFVTTGGNYRLIAANNFGCTDTALVTVALYAKPLLGIDRTAQICPGFTANLAGLYNTAGLVSQWSIGGQPIADSSRVGVGGVYRLIATNSSGCSDTVLTTLTMLAAPSLGADTTLHNCPGFAVNLQNLYNTSGLTATWSFNSLPAGNPAAVTDSGRYTLTVTNAPGCRDTATATLVTDPKPSLGADQSIRFCPGFSGNLTILYAVTGLNTAWTLGGAAVPNPSTITAAGMYRLIAINGFGCADTADVNAVISVKPSLGNDTSVAFCPGFSTDLTTLYNTTGLTVVWTLNGNVVSNPARTDVSGSYRLVVTNAFGCNDTAFVSVSRNPKPILGSDKTITVCQGVAVDMSAQFTFTNLTPVWTINGVTVSNPSAVTAAGDYRVIATNATGCSDTAWVLLTVNPKPALGGDSTVKICPGGNLDLQTIYSTQGLQTLWAFGGSAVGNPSSVNTDGSYRLIATNTFGCSDTAFVTLVTDVNPTLVITNPGVICYPALADLTAPAITAGSSSGILLSYWKNSDGTGAVTDPAAVPAGVYHIRAVNATGCITIRPVSVAIHPLIAADAGGDITVCRGEQGLLQGRVSNAVGPVTYLWSPAAGLASPSGASTTVNPDTTRTYVLNVKDNYGCSYSVFDSVIVTVPPPVPAFAGNDTTLSRGLPQMLQASGGVAYQWSPANLFNNPFFANPLVTLNADSAFLMVMVKDAAGCVGYDTIKVKTLPGVTYYVPTAFSPNGDGLNDVFRAIPVGIASTEYFRIFNRYGETVFLTSDIRRGWDGTYKGIPQPVGNYVWVLKGKGGNGRVVAMSGNVVLVR
jgi:gliding motility-associated-like protein